MAGKQLFPKWKFHADGSSLIVHSAEAEAALGDGWADSPDAFKEPPAPLPTEAEAEKAEVGEGPAKKPKKAKSA